MTKIAVIGAGYVGLTTSACFAHLGHDVICIDIDQHKINNLQRGQVPILEDGLMSLVTDLLERERLKFTTEVGSVSQAEFVFLCVPTPQSPNGQADLSFVETAAAQIAPHLKRSSVVINKSTVPVGSTRIVERAMRRSDVYVASNPEFLREGTAVHDFLNPDRIVVGCDDEVVALRVADLYKTINAPVLVTDASSAELIKYAANAFLATKLSFVNAIATICEGVGADIRDVVRGIGLDKRIGHDFLKPGPGWGGSCFPKDTKALVRIAAGSGYTFDLLEGVIRANQEQFERTADRIAMGLKVGDVVAVWGLTFKALTDDLRDSPSLEVIKRLIERGFRVSAFDPTVATTLPEFPSVQIARSAIEACRGASVLAVLTEWEDFRWIEPDLVAQTLVTPRILDGRNLLDASLWRSKGFNYQSIGR